MRCIAMFTQAFPPKSREIVAVPFDDLGVIVLVKQRIDFY
jgi:hypothetical protein